MIYVSKIKAKKVDSEGDDCGWCNNGELTYSTVEESKHNNKDVINVYICSNCNKETHRETYNDEELLDKVTN